MTVMINLSPEKEAALRAQAQAHGLSIEEWILQIAEHAAQEQRPVHKEVDNLADLMARSPFRGLDPDFEREKDTGRDISL